MTCLGSLASVAAGIGVKFGCSVPNETFIANAFWRKMWHKHTAVYTLGNMKMDVVQPSQGEFDLTKPQSIIDIAGAREFLAHGLVYPATGPAWMQSVATESNWRGLIYDHIAGCAPVVAQTERVQVFNEAILNLLGGGGWRASWLNTVAGDDGSDVIYSFEVARAIYPGKKLFYGDNYLEHDEADGKRSDLYDLLDRLQADDLIDGVYLQGHLQTTWGFAGDDYRALLQELHGRGLEVCITEFDVANSTYADLNLFDRIASIWTERLFSIALEEGVTWFNTWGVLDDWSFLNSAIPGYTQRPLLFDANGGINPIARAIRSAFQGAAGA